MHSTRHDFLWVAPKEVLCAPIFVWMLSPVIIQHVFERFPLAMRMRFPLAMRLYIYTYIYIYIYIYIDRERERERKGKYPKTDPAQKDAGLERGKVNIITVTFTKSIKVNNILLYYWANDTVEDVILWCWKFRAIALRYVNSYFKRSETQFVLWCMQF